MSRVEQMDQVPTDAKMSKAPRKPSLYAKRAGVYPKAVSGIARDVKWAVLLFCLTVYYTLPWVRWDRGSGRPTQAVLLDIDHERFNFFSLELWPQDIYFLTGALILAAVGLFLVTSLFGRIWCGYACPQTVWTDLFMWVERVIEGDRNERMRRDRLLDRRRLDHVFRRCADGDTGILGGRCQHAGLWLHPAVYRNHLSAGRLGARAGLHVYVPLAAFSGIDAGRTEHHRHVSGLAR